MRHFPLAYCAFIGCDDTGMRIVPAIVMKRHLGIMKYAPMHVNDIDYLSWVTIHMKIPHMHANHESANYNITVNKYPRESLAPSQFAYTIFIAPQVSCPGQ